MANEAESKLKLSAIDKMSRVVDNISKRFPKLTKNVKDSARGFQVAQKRSEKYTKAMSKMGSKMKNVGSKMTLGLTVPIVAFGALALKTGTDFQKSMNRVESLTGSTGKELDKMRKQAMKLGSTTEFSATQAGDAMAFFGQAGFDANEIMAATPATLALASASQTDLATTADILSNVMGGFNIKAEEAGRVSDVLAITTAKGNVNMLQLSETMKDAAPVALKFGASIEETSALTAKLGDAGIQGSKAGTTLKNMFLKLASPTERIKKIMGALGVKVVDPVTGKMRKMTDILVDMNKSFGAKNIKGAKKLAILNEIFGKRAIAGAGVLLDAVSKVDATTGVNSVAALTKEIENSNGAAERMQKINQKGLPGAFKGLASSFEGVQLAMLDMKFGGEKLSTIIEKLVNKVTKFFQSLSTGNSTMLKWIVVIGGVLAVLGPMIATLGILLTIIPSMVTGFNLLAAGFGLLKAATIGANVALLPYIVAIGLLATAAFLIMKNWKPIKQFFADLFTSPLENIKDMVKWMGQLPGLNKLFGDDTDKKLSAQGFKIKEAGGEDAGSRVAVKESAQNKLRQKKAMVDINFANKPKDTRVTASDKDSIIGDLTGLMGIGG